MNFKNLAFFASLREIFSELYKLYELYELYKLYELIFQPSSSQLLTSILIINQLHFYHAIS